MTELGTVRTEISWNLGITVVGFLGLFAGGVWAFADASNSINDLINRMDKYEAGAVVRRATTDTRFSKIEDRIAPLDNYQYRTTTVEAQVKAINERLDRGFDSQRDAMEALRVQIGNMSVQLGILTQRFDSVIPRKGASNISPSSTVSD
jgi:hypothetical protein